MDKPFTPPMPMLPSSLQKGGERPLERVTLASVRGPLEREPLPSFTLGRRPSPKALEI